MIPVLTADIPVINTSAPEDPLAELKQQLCSDNDEKLISDNDNKQSNNENLLNKENESLEPLPRTEVKNDVESPRDENNKLDVAKSEKAETESLPVLKITMKDGKQTVSQIDNTENKKADKTKSSEKEKSNKHKSSSKDKSTSSSSSRSSSKHSSKLHSSSSSSSSHRSSSNSPNRHSNKEKSRDKSKHSSSSKTHNSSSRKSSDKSSSSRSKDKDSKNKEKDVKNEKKNIDQNDKSNELDKKPPSIHKLGKIPKLGDLKKEKPSLSIEIRKPEDPKPKTVKTFHSKFRKHGLEEEIKPPPPRASLVTKKSSPVVPPIVTIPKRPSPVHNDTPPEKKAKTVELVDKPGAIKLIPAKPKRKCYILSNILNVILMVHLLSGKLLSTLHQHVPLCVHVCLLRSMTIGKSKNRVIMGSKIYVMIAVIYFLQINAEIDNINFFVKY